MNSFSRAFRVLSLAAIPCAAGGCVTNPKAEALRQQQMIEFGDAINEVRVNVGEMAATLDSLRSIVARQDTTIARLANVTGVVVVK